MKGYKALDMEMKAVNGNGMQYEMGRLYSVEGEVIPCKNGFHFCKSIEEINGYYNIADSKIFEVEAYGQVIKHGNKYVAEKIRLRREFTKEEIKRYFKRKQRKLVESSSWYIRQAVARQGCGLDILIKDGHWCVRATVAEQNYGLEELIYDNNNSVRLAAWKMLKCTKS